ncbi:MAG: methyltransferase type 11 [Novosphingobium sp. PASSN1]|nr:MAG: methyltransferase type 11 [Novosphingobium sp. PASSN1]
MSDLPYSFTYRNLGCDRRNWPKAAAGNRLQTEKQGQPVTDDVIASYDAQSAELAERYDQPSLLASYQPVEALLEPRGENPLALDIGAGAGREARWLKTLGYEVVAVEPSSGMRREGERRHSGEGIRWLDDRLPGLLRLHGLGLSFDLILLSAVWQHVAPTDRQRAFRKMSALLKPGGLLLMTLRQGPAPSDRPMHVVTLGEVEALARGHGLEVLKVVGQADELARPDVHWITVVLRMPDEGTGALPLIRGIILADDKSSTYKLGLLRAIARVAEHAPAAAKMAIDDLDAVDVPLGLVGLFWIRMYLPLVQTGLPQAPRNRGPDGLGFARQGFRALMGLGFAAADLRVGAQFRDERAQAVGAAITDAVRTIVAMPSNFITLPGTGAQVFRASKLRAPKPEEVIALDLQTLGSWGSLRIPGHIWRTMSRLGVWIEPVLVTEWVRLIRAYAERQGIVVPAGQAEVALAWEEPVRDTAIGRTVALQILDRGGRLSCCWSNKELKPAVLDIDHCLPWTLWPCSDLWNLLPSDRRVNQHQKRDRIPSAARMQDARGRIIGWWSDAWLGDRALAERFCREVGAALPVQNADDLEDVFDGVSWRRLRLRQDQQAPEWSG